MEPVPFGHTIQEENYGVKPIPEKKLVMVVII